MAKQTRRPQPRRRQTNRISLAGKDNTSNPNLTIRVVENFDATSGQTDLFYQPGIELLNLAIYALPPRDTTESDTSIIPRITLRWNAAQTLTETGGAAFQQRVTILNNQSLLKYNGGLTFLGSVSFSKWYKAGLEVYSTIPSITSFADVYYNPVSITLTGDTGNVWGGQSINMVAACTYGLQEAVTTRMVVGNGSLAGIHSILDYDIMPSRLMNAASVSGARRIGHFARSRYLRASALHVNELTDKDTQTQGPEGDLNGALHPAN